jgi:hypothetical protein
MKILQNFEGVNKISEFLGCQKKGTDSPSDRITSHDFFFFGQIFFSLKKKGRQRDSINLTIIFVVLRN